MPGQLPGRRLPIGAEVLESAGVNFRVWAPQKKQVEVLFEDGHAVTLAAEGDGYHSATVKQAGSGTLYKYRLDGGEAYPDPASRFQPRGPHGYSQVVDPRAYTWRERAWNGCSIQGQVIYELHVGTFTREGTYDAAARQFPELAALGVTVVELMPVSEFPGRFGWGYDGVHPFAPTRLYGTPDDLRRLVDRAHECGIAVILDVVYNHLGPDGNYFGQFSQDYFTPKHKTDWGEAINFDGDNNRPVREFFIANAGYWIDEFHFDGLRLDATQNIYDDSTPHILAEIAQRVREAGGTRATIIIGENEPQERRLIDPPEKGGHGLDALWNDDLHHSAMVALTGHNGAYYSDYQGKPQELISAIKYGYLYQGQWYQWQKQRRGTSCLRVSPPSFVTFLENHDQVANSARGQRVHQLTTPGRFKAMTALLLLAPGTPMLFQGQEFASSHPFLFFADHQPELAKLVREGRGEFLGQWLNLRLPEMQKCFADPSDLATFERCKLDFSEREKNIEIYHLHRDLLKLRRERRVFRTQRRGVVDGAVLAAEAFVLRYFDDENEQDLLVLVNFGLDLHLDPAPEPLLAPPDHRQWSILLSTESPRYGGCGTSALDSDANWRIPGHAAVVLEPVPVPQKKKESSE